MLSAIEIVVENEVADLSRVWGGEGLANRAYFERVEQDVVVRARAIVEALVRIEELLVLTDRVLRVTQPPMPGKLGIRWWLTRSDVPVRFPVLVSWQRLTSGRWRSKRVPQVRRDRLNRQGSAALNVEETYLVALMANRLIKSYTDLLSRLHAGAAGLNKAYWQTVKLFPDTEATLRLCHKDAVQKLLNAGYELDVDALELIEKAGL